MSRSETMPATSWAWSSTTIAPTRRDTSSAATAATLSPGEAVNTMIALFLQDLGHKHGFVLLVSIWNASLAP